MSVDTRPRIPMGRFLRGLCRLRRIARLAATPVCYRKSVRFEELVGQDQATAILRRAMSADRLAHAYLFEGPVGVGLRCAVVALGMALFCVCLCVVVCGVCV